MASGTETLQKAGELYWQEEGKKAGNHSALPTDKLCISV